MKTCSRCRTAKEDTEFNKNKSNKDGLQVYCRDCGRDISRKYEDSIKEHRAMAQKPETLFRKKVVDWLKTMPFTHVFSIQQTTIVGTPDLLCCVRGQFVAIELKSAGGKESELQKYQLKKVSEAGGIALCIYPEDLHLLQHTIRRIVGGFEND